MTQWLITRDWGSGLSEPFCTAKLASHLSLGLASPVHCREHLVGPPLTSCADVSLVA